MTRSPAAGRPRTFVREPAVVLSRRPGPRTSQWVWFYGERSGLLEVIAEAARRPRRLVAGTLEPLSVGWLTYRQTGDSPPHRLISFDLTWSPYVVLHAAGRPVDPPTLLFVALVSETAQALLLGHPGDAYVFQRLTEVSRLMPEGVPYRALAIGWLWTILVRLGELSLEGTCPACGRPVGGPGDADVVWDAEGHPWHPTCGPGPGTFGFPASAALRRTLARLQTQGLTWLGDFPQVARALAHRRGLWDFLVRRTEVLLGRPLQSLATARSLGGAGRGAGKEDEKERRGGRIGRAEDETGA